MRRRLHDEADNIPQINILPMIDVIFSILIFFIIASTFLTRSEGLSVNLPTAKTSQVQKSEEVNITVEPSGKIYLNRKSIKFVQLQSKISKLVNPNSETLVILNADKNAKHGLIVEVMDIVRQIEGVTLAIASQKKN